MRVTAYKLPLRDRDGNVKAYAYISPQDGWAKQHRWHWKVGYAARSVWDGERNSLVYLHRQIMGSKPGDRMDVDHINRDKLDNRRSNLRVLSHRENQHNYPSLKGTSKYRGVSWRKDTLKWSAKVQVDGRTVHLGSYLDEEEAAQAALEGRRRLLSGAVD